MIIFRRLNFSFSDVLSIKNWYIISLLLLLASFAFLGVSIKFTCVGKLGVASKEFERFEPDINQTLIKTWFSMTLMKLRLGFLVIDLEHFGTYLTAPALNFFIHG